MRGFTFLTDFVVDAEPVLDRRAEILDDDIGLLGQLHEDREPVLGLQVEGQAALVAMEILEIEPFAPRAGHVAAVIAALLDLDDIGAPIGELADRSRPGAGMSEVEDGKAGQRQGSDAHECRPSDLRSKLRSKFTSAATLVLSLGGRQARGVPLSGEGRSCPRYRVKPVNPVVTAKTQDKVHDLIG